MTDQLENKNNVEKSSKPTKIKDHGKHKAVVLIVSFLFTLPFFLSFLALITSVFILKIKNEKNKDKKIDVNEIDVNEAFLQAISEGKISSRGTDNDIYTDDENTRLILEKVIKATKDKSSGFNINKLDKNGKTALIHAVESGDLTLVRFLIKGLNADLNVESADWKKPFEFVEHNAEMQELLEEFNYKSLDNVDLSEAFSQAIFEGQIFSLGEDSSIIGNNKTARKILEKVIKATEERDSKSFDINKLDKNGKTALFYAVEAGDLDLVRFLITDLGADMNAQGMEFKTPLEYKIPYQYAENNPEMQKLLKELKRKTLDDLDINEAFSQAVSEGKISSRGTDNDIYTKDEAIRTILEKVMESTQDKSSESFDVNKLDKNGKTALIYAVEAKDLTLVRFLIKVLDADVNTQSKDGTSPLQYAEGNSEIQKLLEEFKYNHLDDLDISELFLQAVSEGKISSRSQGQDSEIVAKDEITQKILDKVRKEAGDKKSKSFDVNKSDENGKTALIYAIKAQDLALVKFLLEDCKADINKKSTDRNKEAPVKYALDTENLEILKYLNSYSKLQKKSIDSENNSVNSVIRVKKGYRGAPSQDKTYTLKRYINDLENSWVKKENNRRDNLRIPGH